MSGRRMIRGRIGAITALVAAFLLGSASYGAVQLAGATGPSVTYFGCLSAKGGLTKVGTTSPTCPTTATVISWNSQGPAGTPGTNGTSMTVGSAAPTGSCISGNSEMVASGEVYACQSSAWIDTGVSLKGATGATGSVGPQGPQGVTPNTCTSIPGPNENFSFCALSTASPGSNLAFVDLQNSLLIQTQLVWANLGSADLAGANLSGANLSDAALTNANMANVNATNANLSNANMTGATMTGATITGVNWSGTICPDGTPAGTHLNTCVGHGA